jgi:PGF-CTERM protein
MGLAELIFGICRNRSRLEMYDVNFGGIERMTKRLTIALVALAMFVLVAVMPVAATNNGNYYVVANVINQGATVFIGEQGLNVQQALTDARGASTTTRIGWWASAAVVATTPFSQSYDFGPTGASSFTVGDTFVGYTGPWYALADDGTALGQIFNVQDPTLSINIWDWDQSADVTSKSVPQGETLGFKVSTNMISALDSSGTKPHRQPILNTMAGDGYINIRVKDESGATFTQLYNKSATLGGELEPLSSLNVSVSPYFWGIQPGTVITPGTRGNWSTGALNANGQQAYAIGTYTVYAESKLNNMKDNYKNGGVDYTTKTISQTVTVSLVSNTVKIEANKDSVVRSKPFSVTVTGKPKTTYHLWIKGSSNLAGGLDGQPPMINVGQDGVTYVTIAACTTATDQRAFTLAQAEAQTPATANPPGSALNYAYQNAGANRVVYDDVSHVAETGFGSKVAVNIATLPSGVRTVEFVTTNWTKAQKYTIRVEQNFGTPTSPAFKSDEVDVKVEKGAVTIVAAGDQSYFLGEEIKFSGTNTESYKTYLFIIGPNLNENGAQLVAPRTSVINQNPDTFVQADVAGDNTWSYKWGTATVPLDAGTYTVYAVSQPVDRAADHIGDAAYGTVSIIIKKPFVSATASQSTVAKGDRIYITGTAEGQPSPGVAIWVLGKNYALYQTESVNSDSSFKYEIKQEDTKSLTSGQYFVVVQHPMANNQFDIDLNPSSSGRLGGSTAIYVRNEILNTVGTNVFLINGAGALQGSDAAEALVEAINDPNVDDTYTKLQFLIEEPDIIVDPIGDRHVGDKFTITAKTNLAVDDEVLVQVYSSSFKPTQKSQSGEFSGATGTIKVTKGDSGLNALSFDVDASTFKPDEYIVTEDAVIQEATGVALFNVLEGPAPTAVPTTVVTTVPTPVVTTVPTTATPTPTPTPTPGFGALIALIGLGAIAFIVVRRH